MYQKGQNRTTCAWNHTKKYSRKYLKRLTTPRKENRKHVQQYWQRAHAPVEMSKPVENVTNYRAKQNNVRTDQRHPQKKIDFTKLRVRVRAGVPRRWFWGPRGVKMPPPYLMILVYLRGTLLSGKMSSLKRGVDLRWASLKRGRLYQVYRSLYVYV